MVLVQFWIIHFMVKICKFIFFHEICHDILDVTEASWMVQKGFLSVCGISDGSYAWGEPH